jgi:hypothetical protein
MSHEPDRLKVIGDDIYYGGKVVAKIVIPESTVREKLVTAIDGTRIAYEEGSPYA